MNNETRIGGDYWAVAQLFLYYVLPLGLLITGISQSLGLTPKFWFNTMAITFGLFLIVPFILALI